MGAELGATTTRFSRATRRSAPSCEAEDRRGRLGRTGRRRRCDYTSRNRLTSRDRAVDRQPSSPGTWCAGRVRRSRAEDITQDRSIGSSANPGLRDFAIVAASGGRTADGARRQLPTSTRRREEILTDLTKMGATTELVIGGARSSIQAGCMGLHRHGPGAGPPAATRWRTMPRKLPRSLWHQRGFGLAVLTGNRAASALTGVITESARLGARRQE